MFSFFVFKVRHGCVFKDKPILLEGFQHQLFGSANEELLHQVSLLMRIFINLFGRVLFPIYYESPCGCLIQKYAFSLFYLLYQKGANHGGGASRNYSEPPPPKDKTWKTWPLSLLLSASKSREIVGLVL